MSDLLHSTTAVAGDSTCTTVDVLHSAVALEAATDLRDGGLDSATVAAADSRWLGAVCVGLRHEPYLLVAKRHDEVVGRLPLALVKSALFGRFLVSLPYVNTAGAIADNADTATSLVDRAVQLADELNVRYLELRHERELAHPALTATVTTKVHMRLALPATTDELWEAIKSKVRNKVNKGDRQGFTIHWGSHDLLAEFYDVFSHTMRDLGTPVFSKRLFQAILTDFAGEAELCVVRSATKPIATGLLIHGKGVTQIPSASSLWAYNSTNANDWMYWHLLKRTVERGQQVFDFGRCSMDGNTFTFKKKWGAEPQPAVWQYYVRQGRISDMRLEGGKYGRAVQVWKKLPVWLTRLIGPPIVRGIP